MTMKKITNKRLSAQRGFSMVEIVVVLGIMMVLSSIALPSVLQSMAAYRLNSATTDLQNIIETARFNAVRRNTEIDLRQTVIGGRTYFYVDIGKTGAYANSDPTFVVPTYVQLAPAAAPAAGTTGLPNTKALGGGCIGFNGQGVAVYTTCGGGVPSVWFISLGMNNGTGGYRAITVTTMGQAKTWGGSASGTWKAM